MCLCLCACILPLDPTFGESFGYVVAEALAMELPIIATAVGSIPELVDESNGFLVSPTFQSGNLQVQVVDKHFLTEMTNCVLKLMSDPDLRADMGSRGRARLHSRGMTMRDFGNAHANFYESLHEISAASDNRSRAGHHVRVDAQEWAARVLPRQVQPSPPLVPETRLSSRNSWWGPMPHDLGVYVINLDRSPERLASFLDEASKHGLDTEKIFRVSAVDGRFLSESTGHKKNSTVVDTVLDYCPDIENGSGRCSSHFSVRFIDLQFLGPQVIWAPGNIAVTLSHLQAIRTAFDRGDTVALVFEDDTRFDGQEDSSESGGFAAVLDAAAQLSSDWTVLQLGHLTGDDTDQLRRLAEAWKRNILLVSRMPCGNADWRIFGLHAYLMHRRGMALLLDAWWPGGSGEQPSSSSSKTPPGTKASSRRGVGNLAGLSFDLRLAGRVFSESIVLNLPGVYVATRPLFMQRHDAASDTDHIDSNKHERYRASNSWRAMAEAFSGGENGMPRARGVEFFPPALETMRASSPVDYYVSFSLNGALDCWIKSLLACEIGTYALLYPFELAFSCLCMCPPLPLSPYCEGVAIKLGNNSPRRNLHARSALASFGQPL